MSDNGYELNDNQKMLAIALHAHGVTRQGVAAIMMVLEDDEQVSDMAWFVGQNPTASEERLIAVAYQIVKEAHDNNGQN